MQVPMSFFSGKVLNNPVYMLVFVWVMSALREKEHTSSALLLEWQSMRQETLRSTCWKCVVSLALFLSLKHHVRMLVSI